MIVFNSIRNVIARGINIGKIQHFSCSTYDYCNTAIDKHAPINSAAHASILHIFFCEPQKA